MYHHRGAYLNAIEMAIDLHLDAASRYLWTLAGLEPIARHRSHG